MASKVYIQRESQGYTERNPVSENKTNQKRTSKIIQEHTGLEICRIYVAELKEILSSCLGPDGFSVIV